MRVCGTPGRSARDHAKSLHPKKEDEMTNLKRLRNLYLGATFVAFLIAIVVGQSALEKLTAAQGRSSAQAPSFKVDPLWPKPLPNHWILGSVTGVAVDAQDHIWLVHRGADSLTARTENGLG